MSDRSGFSYWGSWEQLHEAQEPVNGEADIAFARTLVLSGVAIKQVAANLPNGRALVSAADQAMAEWEDDYCGRPPRPVRTLTLAASLAAFAGTLQEGELQIAIQEEASRIRRKAFAVSTAAPPPGVNISWC